MTKNFKFCNIEFLPLFNSKPYYFYNQFYNKAFTSQLLDSMGDHPNCKIEFKYNDKKRIRATFITFDDAINEMDVKCICILFHGDRNEYYCYFYELHEDGSIGCVEVANNNDDNRIVRYLNAGTNTNEYFKKLCSFFGESKYETVTMLFYKETDDCFRILDMDLSQLDSRSLALLGSTPTKTCEIHNNIKFVFYKSQEDSSYLVARTNDGINIVDALLSDIDCLKKD